MVHKKSEYSLQFHVLPSDLRKQIWQENIKFREYRRNVNLADHFWSYQLVDKCDCDIDVEDHDQVKDGSPGLKYDLTTAGNTENVQEVSATKQNKENLLNDCKVTLKNIGVQTIEPPVIVHLGTRSNNEKYSSEASEAPNSEQTENNLKKLDVIHAESVSTSPETNKSTKKEPRMSPQRNVVLKNARQLHPSSSKQLRPSSAVQFRSSCAKEMRARSASLLRPSSVCSKTSSTSTFRRPRSPSPRFSVLSRTSRRSHLEQPRSSFAAYGWNDTKKNVGDKKTYNVLAPQPEVYPFALQAMRSRQIEIEECLAQENRILNAGENKMNVVNHSSIWMSEYKEKFSRPPGVKKPVQRPLSSHAQRSVLWSVS